MREKIECLIRSGKSTKEMQKEITDFPQTITTEYFQKMGFDETESIKLKWILKKNDKKLEEEKRAAELRRELLKENCYKFSPNANPNYVLLDTSTLQLEKGIELLENSEKVVVIESTLNEIEKVLKQKKEMTKKSKEDRFLIKNLIKYKRKILEEVKYKKVFDECEKYKYVDDKILYFLNNLSEKDRPTLITADINLANRADSCGLEYILILKIKQNREEKFDEIKSEPKIQPNSEPEEVKDKTKTNIFGVSFRIKEEKMVIKKYNPKPVVYFIKDGQARLSEFRDEILIPEIDYMILLLRAKSNRIIYVVKLVIVNNNINVVEEKITFLNEIYQLELPEEIQEVARELLIS